MKDKILLFIPMYNCEKQIIRVLSQLDKQTVTHIDEVIVVNNRSTDNGESVVKEFLKKSKIKTTITLLTNNKNYNLGGSHKVAFNYAKDNNFDYIIVLHGDDQGSISDFIPILKKKTYRNFDAVLGARFIKGARLIGYSKIRIFGNKVFNTLFSIVSGKKVYDLGSGLNMYKVKSLKRERYLKYPDTLYFNDLLILSLCYYKQKVLFVPISWREEDQVSNNKLLTFSIQLLKMLWKYTFVRKKYMNSQMTTNNFDYTSTVIFKKEEKK